MPVLAAFFGSMLSGLIAWLGQYFTKRTANYVALVALTATAGAAMWAAGVALTASLLGAMPSFLAVPLSWVIPANFNACISALFSAHVICAGYRWHRDTVRAAAAA